tara:strand:- start:294 stop:920 length:627 start_codon:yes stop_codon:yes gene_type:complete
MNKFITFEGIDGCGKTTQINLVSKYLNSIKEDNIIVREPGGTEISEKIRQILLDEKNQISHITETLLFLSSRSQLMNQVVIDNIEKKKFTICDRYTDSTLAYQGYGRGLNIDTLNMLNDFATSHIKPDITFILDIELSESIKRVGENKDRMEQSGLDFLARVKKGYYDIAMNDKNRYKLVDCGHRSIESINNEIIDKINNYYKELINV